MAVFCLHGNIGANPLLTNRFHTHAEIKMSLSGC